MAPPPPTAAAASGGGWRGRKAAGSVEVPTSAQIAALAGSYAGDESQYDESFHFVKSASATHGPAWGFSPAGGTTIFTNGRKQIVRLAACEDGQPARGSPMLAPRSRCGPRFENGTRV